MIDAGPAETPRAVKFREAFPILYVDDVERAVAFYGEQLGFEQSYRFPAEGELEFAFLRLDPLGIGISRMNAEQNSGHEFELCIYTDDVDAAAERLRAAGAKEVQLPEDQPWSERLTYFRDPHGHLLHITAKID